MGSPRAIVSVKANQNGSGASGVARYIAQSKLDKQREGEKDRALFSSRHSDLTYRQANRLLSQELDGPAKKDVVHLVISTTEEEYERLGATEEERLEALRGITRETVSEIEKSLNIEELHWFAGIHRNTDNPHVHLAFRRDAISLENFSVKRIEHLPKSLLTHKEKGIDGTEIIRAGEIADRFVASLDQAQERFREREEHEHEKQRQSMPEQMRETEREKTVEHGGQEHAQTLQLEEQVRSATPQLTINAFHTVLMDEHGEVVRGNGTQSGAGIHLALDQPSTHGDFYLKAHPRQREKVEFKHVVVDPQKIHDPQGLIPGSDPEKSRADADAHFLKVGEIIARNIEESLRGNPDGHLPDTQLVADQARRGIYELEQKTPEIESQAWQELGYTGRAWRFTMDENRGEARRVTELLIFDRSQVKDGHVPVAEKSEVEKEKPSAKERSSTKESSTKDRAADGETDRQQEQPEPEKSWKEQYRERYIIGRAMVARGQVEELSSFLKNARENGDNWRLKIFDASHDRNRRMSALDLRRRADARASRQVAEQVILDKAERQQARQEAFEIDVANHSHSFDHHRTILQKTIRKIERDLKQAQETYGALKPRALAIQREYDNRGQPLPLPLISSQELTKLQDQAIARRNPARFSLLEQIRQNLGQHADEHLRSDRETSRLSGQALTARSDHELREHRAAQFEEHRHLAKWEIDGRKWSLAEVDQELAKRCGEAKFFKNPVDLLPTGIHSPIQEAIRLVRVLGRNSNLLPSKRRAAQAEVLKLTEIRAVIEARIDERRQTLASEVKLHGQLSETLGASAQQEVARRRELGLTVPRPVLSRPELNRLEQNARTLKDPEMLKLYHALETGGISPDPSSTRVEMLAGRSLARELLSEISLSEAQNRLEDFGARQKFSPVVFKDAEGRDRTASLLDVRSEHSLIHHVVDRVFESREDRLQTRAVEQGIGAQQLSLQTEAESARHFYETAHAMAESYRAQFAQAGQMMPPPIFTPKEMNTLEVFAARQVNAEARQHFEAIIERAEIEGRVHTLESSERDQAVVQPSHSGQTGHQIENSVLQAPVQEMGYEYGDDLTFTH